MRRRGFTMVEVLVAVLLLAVGLVGALAMQAHAMRTRQESVLLTEALQAAATLAERMRANGVHSSDYVGFELDATREPAAPQGFARSCSDVPCDAAALALRELEEFRQQLLHTLPSARAAICRDASASAGGQLQWECSNGAAAPVVIKIGWRSRVPARATIQPAIALPVAFPPAAAPVPAPVPAPAPAQGGVP